MDSIEVNEKDRAALLKKQTISSIDRNKRNKNKMYQ